MYDIIKNAGVPEGCYRKGKYPFAKMDVGDAFDVPCPDGLRGKQARIGASAISWSKGKGRNAKFTVRRLDETTVRCTRIA